MVIGNPPGLLANIKLDILKTYVLPKMLVQGRLGASVLLIPAQVTLYGITRLVSEANQVGIVICRYELANNCTRGVNVIVRVELTPVVSLLLA